MAKKDDLTPKQAEEIIKKFCEPPYNAEEIRLKEDVRLVLKGEGKGYEGDDDEEEEGDSPQNNGATENATAQATQSQGSSVIENAQQYAGEIIANVQSLGAAGSVALSSATYFQAETVVESSHDIVAIVEEVEEDYDMTLQNYFVETTATFLDDVSDVIPIVEKAADALYNVSDNMETKAERIERQEAEAEQKTAEQEAKQAEKSEAEAEKQAERQAEKEQRQQQRQEAKEQRQAEKEAEKSEAKSEEQKSEQKSEEPKQEPKAEEPKSEPKPEPQAEELKPEAKAEEVKPEPKAEEPIPETPVDNEMMDEIKPHSDVESDDSGSIIDNFPQVETPFMDDSTVRPVSPVSSNTRPVSPAG